MWLQIDRLYGWKSAPDTPVRDAFKRQKDFVMKEFEQRSEQVFLQLNEQVCGQQNKGVCQTKTASWRSCIH